ncbi:MAG: TonB-dependent receptor plug domain-containing protein, partial [Duncaniella sp.]|nr:TonB-dependent receptor plug domain-containing protein [Duncaniella sp.]
MTKHELLLAACAMMATPMVNAQDAAEVPQSDGAIDSIATISLHAIEVSALRATQNTPVAQTTISKKQLEKSNDGRDLPFLLSMTPSVVTTSDAGAGVGYSGIRVRGTDASRINVMANGVPINDSESHNVYWVNMPDLVSSLRDVQIQRGAGTSVNGAGAFGASINMVTDAPQEEPYAVLNGSYGSFNTHKETINLGTGLLGDHWTIDARLSNIGSDGYVRRASSDLWSYLGQVAYSRPGTNIRLLAFGGKESTYMAWDYASREQMALYGRRYNPCGEYIDGDGNVAYYPDQKDNFTQHHFQLHLSQRINDRWHLSAALFYTKGEGHYDQYKQRRTLVEYGLEPFYDADGNKIKKSDLIRLKYNDNDFGGANVNANYSYGRLDMSVGGSANQFIGRHFGHIKWVRDYINTSHPLNPLQEYYNNTGKKFDANIYARANVAISRPFSAFADMQYRHIDYKINGITDNYYYNISLLYTSPSPRDAHESR